MTNRERLRGYALEKSPSALRYLKKSDRKAHAEYLKRMKRKGKGKP